MEHTSICLTFTKREFEFFNKRALMKKKTLWVLLQSEIEKSFGGIEISIDNACIGDKAKVVKPIKIPTRTWRTIVCLSSKLGLTPTQLVYRLIIAPYLSEIIKEYSLVAGVPASE